MATPTVFQSGQALPTPGTAAYAAAQNGTYAAPAAGTVGSVSPISPTYVTSGVQPASTASSSASSGTTTAAPTTTAPQTGEPGGSALAPTTGFQNPPGVTYGPTGYQTPYQASGGSTAQSNPVNPLTDPGTTVDLSGKYNTAFNSSSGQPVPQTGGEARSAVGDGKCAGDCGLG